MRIAICDDNQYMSGKVEELVKKSFNGNALSFTCHMFTSAESLLTYLEKNPLDFQIYILDIEMAGMNGLDAAKEIRRQDSEAIIIFLTSHDELISEAFQVFAFEYLIKPLDEDRFEAVLLSALKHIESRQKIFQFIIQKRRHSLYVHQILYFESIGRKMVIHTIDGRTEEYYGTLKAALEKLPKLTFSQAHNSYVLNLEHVDIVESTSVRIKQNISIPIGQKYHRDFHKDYRKYVLSQMGR